MQHLPILDYLKVFLVYCINPTHRDPKINEPQYSNSNLISGFFILFVCYMIVMSSLSSALGLEEMDHAFLDLQEQIPMWGIFLAAVIVAPFIEEAIFRFPIKFFDRGFPIVFWIFTLVFAGLHVANFSVDPSDYWKMPLLVIPQLVLGFYLGFIRMQFSWPYAVGIHMLNNLIPTVMLIIAEVIGIEVM